MTSAQHPPLTFKQVVFRDRAAWCPWFWVLFAGYAGFTISKLFLQVQYARLQGLVLRMKIRHNLKKVSVESTKFDVLSRRLGKIASKVDVQR